MLPKLASRMLTEIDPRLLGRFAWLAALKGAPGMLRFRLRRARGRIFPAVVFVSVTDRCNLRCQGCWVGPSGGDAMPPARLDGIIAASKRRGSWFFGILGGEPLMYEPLWDVLGRHRDCYFQVFTNGTMLDAPAARAMRRLGNVTPLISIEGLEATGDERRGGSGVFTQAMTAIDRCRDAGLMIGVATSVCRSNIDELVSYEFVDTLIARGVHYLWYYIYRPVGPRPTPQLALDRDEIMRLRRFMVAARCIRPLLIVDAYWDDAGRAVCPAAAGVSYHVNPRGDVEPCPPIQFAADRINGDGAAIADVIEGSSFLRGFSTLAGATTPGCVLMEDPGALRRFVTDCGARDSSGRGTALDELAASSAHPSQDSGGEEIPEAHWFYRFAKRCWFLGTGAYG
jgi:MoaA/NifB/PqqE/SkfB family radical SAM enzyme